MNDSTPQLTPHVPYNGSAAIGRFNAWFFDTFDGLIDWSLRRVKRQVYRNIPLRLVEIGPGIGANFRYYPRGTEVIAIEPNHWMHERLRENATKAGIRLRLSEGVAEEIPLPDESVDLVISNLVLCTVVDQRAAAKEIHRILKPNGRFLLVEHIVAKGLALRALQRVLRRPWKTLFEGCELQRDTLATLIDVGFDIGAIHSRTVPTIFVPVNSMIYGEALKLGSHPTAIADRSPMRIRTRPRYRSRAGRKSRSSIRPDSGLVIMPSMDEILLDLTYPFSGGHRR